MEKKLIENCIKDIDGVIKSKTSTLSRKDFEKLIKIREGLKNSKTKNSVKKYLEMLLKLIGIASSIRDSFK